MLPRLALMASGNGTIVQAIFDAITSQVLKAEIVGLICDQPGAKVLTRAQDFGVKSFITPMQLDRSAWDKSIIQTLDSLQPDLVASAGFMRILSKDCVERFRIVNSHPALLTLFPGAHAVAEAIAAGATQTGSTIHWVDSGIDTGEIISQEAVAIFPEYTVETLHERIKMVERKLYVATLQTLLSKSVRS